MGGGGPKLRVSVGPTRSALEVVATNYDVTGFEEVESGEFEGRIGVRIRDFSGQVGHGKEARGTTESEYFERYPSLTWSMAIQGRFKEEVNADDVLFGNIFDHPIRDHLPYGTSAALKFVNYVDPALEQDLYADKPWALSPLIATMNHMSVESLSDPSNPPEWSASQPEDDVSVLFGATSTSSSSSSPSSSSTSDGSGEEEGKRLRGDPASRRTYFAKKENRKRLTFRPDHWLNLDFCNGYLDFNTFSLKIPGGLHFSLMRYWDGQPVTYVCRSRDGKKEYFYIVFEIIDEEGAGGSRSPKASKDAAADRERTEDEKKDGQEVDDLGVD